MSDRYSYSLTTFSPSGKLVQIENAMKAVESGAPSVGIKVESGALLAVEKKFNNTLIDPSSVKRIEKISHFIGMVYSGLSPDFQVLVKHARKHAMEYENRYGESIPPDQLVAAIAAVMQEYTQSAGVRPFGVSLLIAGWDDYRNTPCLFQCDSAGTFFPWKATTLGKQSMSSRGFLEKRYNDNLSLEDGVHTAILALKETFEGEVNEKNIEIGVCDAEGFRILSCADINDYLGQIS